MAIPVEMPKMSDTMEEGVLVAWLSEEGDEVSAGDVIAQVETDKATMDLEVYDDGVLLKRVIKEGDSVPIGALIAVLGQKGEDPSEVLARYSGGKAAAPGAESTAAAAEPKAVSSGDGAHVESPAEAQSLEAGGDGAEGRIKASPLARKLAREHDVKLSGIQGTGPEGRIIKRDIEALLGKSAEAHARREASRPSERPAEPAPARPGAPFETLRVSQMRKAIARRLAQSKYSAPHFYLTIDVDMRRADEFRQRLNALAEQQGRPRISFNDLITKASALSLRAHPMVNASYLEQEAEIRRYNDVHVAVAVAMDEGLITPVIRDADQKSLGQIAEETRQLAERARNRQLEPSEYEGSTFTTSNLGMFGIEEFTAIINPPNSCILAIGAVRDVPVVEDDRVVPGKRMKLTLSCDHRIVDGATGAQFMATLRTYLEEPLNLLL
ncbi:MAG TPA: pyruvate dehydrogenase complex dihydrolipoamide acetyltransferase [Rhodothermales bacterium]